MSRLTPEQEAALDAMRSRQESSQPTGTTYERELRAAEQAAQHHAEVAARKRTAGCWTWGGVALGVPLVAFLAFLAWALLDPAPPDPRIDFVVNCERQVRAALKAPATAQISNAFDDGILVTASGYAWTGWVDAENSFGANLRTAFRCSGRPENPTVTF